MRIAQFFHLLFHHIGMQIIVVSHVEQTRHLQHVVQVLLRPLAERHFHAFGFQLHVRVATLHHDGLQVLRIAGFFLFVDGRAFFQQAIQREHIEEHDLAFVDAHRRERVQIHAAQLYIFHAARCQRTGRALAAFADTLGPDAAVKLVFDLQDVGVELLVVTVFQYADFFIFAVGCANRVLQRAHVFTQRIVGNIQPALGVVVITQIAHAQRGAETAEQGVLVERFQLVVAALQERGANRR